VGGANRWTYDSFVNVRRVSGWEQSLSFFMYSHFMWK
jgi:hypothetical protein